MVTTAARISSKVLDSDAWKASAAPWNWVCTPTGMPISCFTWSMISTPLPRAMPGARLNDIITAGNWPIWVIASCAWRSSTRARLDRRTWPPLVVFTWIWSRAAGPIFSPAWACSTTRYWLAWV